MTHLTSSEIIDKVGMLTFQFVKNYICANAAVFVDAEYEDESDARTLALSEEI